MNSIADFLLIVVLIINLVVLGTGRLTGCIRQVAAQGMVLGVLTLFVTEHPWDPRIWFIAAVSFALKGWVFPTLLMRSLRAANVQHESAPIVGYAGSIVCGILIVIASFWMAQQFLLPVRETAAAAEGHRPIGEVLVNAASRVAYSVGLKSEHQSIAQAVLPFALATIVSGLFLIVTRRQALMQVLGYIVLENGIFIFGVALAHEEPVLVEMGILLDVFVGVFVMGIAVFHIGREFDHIDVRQLSQLRD